MKGRRRQTVLAVSVSSVIAFVAAMPAAARAQDAAAPLFRMVAPAPPTEGHEDPALEPRTRTSLFDVGQATTAEPKARRACDGCPVRRPVFATVEVLGINVIYNLMNRLKKPPDLAQFQVKPSDWWQNLTHGFEWDGNAFAVNQFGHPYQGNNYFNAGRSNGLSFWESAPLAALGSATWEYFGEKDRPALNDLINTTAGGIALGEMFHRVGWLVRDTTKTGGARLRGEILGTLIDPVTGLNRFLSGDATRVTAKPADMIPVQIAGAMEAGVLWRASNTTLSNAAGSPYIQVNMQYGDPVGSPYRQPYDGFNVSMRLGGGAPISEATVRGRLHGHFFGDPAAGRQLMVVQAYDYVQNSAYEFGGQSVVMVFTRQRHAPEGTNLVVSAAGGAIILGAFSSPYQYGEARDYDYGPGLWAGLGATLRRKTTPVARLSYDMRLVHVVSGTSGNHVAQHIRADGLIPVRGRLRLGIGLEYVRRKVYYDYADDLDEHYPQARVFLTLVDK